MACASPTIQQTTVLPHESHVQAQEITAGSPCMLQEHTESKNPQPTWSCTSTSSLSISSDLPPAQSPYLHLSHPTPGECLTIWNLTSLAWTDALTLPQYLEESAYLTTVPLAKDGGMSLWILVDKTLPPDQRPILCSCETFRKRSLVSRGDGSVTEAIIHGVASVFCDPIYRRRGYAARMMKELTKVLRSWQVGATPCVGSVLFSDIGKSYYSDFGWHPIPNNIHIKFEPELSSTPTKATKLLSEDLGQLCLEDEIMIRNTLTTISDEKLRMTIVPDIDHMLWHHKKAEFAAQRLFGKEPQVKGAVAGQPGNRIWAIWTHRYYGDPKSASSENVLYILRLVVESQVRESTYNTEQGEVLAEQLKAVLKAAQAEAAEWELDHINLWDPTPLVRELIGRTGIRHDVVERHTEGIASLLWYGNGSDERGAMPEWIGNEHYAWL